MRGLLVALALLLSGCLSAPAPDPDSAPDDGLHADPVPRLDPGVGPPSLPVGLALTYASEQVWNPDKEFTLVVAKADDAGYLFAGAAEDDVAYAAAWGDDFMGPHGRDLEPEGSKAHLFHWPLSDGATWEMVEGFTLRASAADVRTPGGAQPGFVVEGATERMHLRYEYAPSVGFLTSWLREARGRVMEKIELTRVGEAKSWVWFEPAAKPLHAFDPAAPGVVEFAGADAVVVSAGGAGGGRATVTKPDGSAWSRDFPGDAAAYQGTWVQEILPPQEGEWTASTIGSPQTPAPLPAKAPLGWAYVVLAPVKWVRA